MIKLYKEKEDNDGKDIARYAQIDTQTMLKWLNESHNLVHVFESDNNPSKKDVLAEITKSCQNAVAKVDEFNHIEIYYTGSSREEKGNWTLADGDITLIEVLQAVRDGGAQKYSVTIACDCPYSGKWVLEAIQLARTKYMWDFKYLTIDGACSEEISIEWGAFSE